MPFHNHWVVGHERLAKKEMPRIRAAIASRHSMATSLPQLPSNILEWINVARPVVEGKKRSFVQVPFWEEIYKDDYPFKMIVGGRQTFKSTYTTDMLACHATSNPGSQVCYVTFSQQSQTAFSRQKLQVGTFSQNPVLKQFPRNKLGNVSEITLKNDSTIYCTIDSNKYKNIEGKSLDLCMLDEAQYQEMGEAQRVVQAMMATKGKLIIVGIGGESGSAYEKFWSQSDQREWVFDDPNWRDKLRFDELGLVTGDYLKDVLRGKWAAQKPENTICHGYHISQEMFCTIPLTIEDAVLKYKVNPMFSVEYQRKNTSASVYTTNTLGEFYKSDSIPVTAEMVLACMTPYRYLELMKPDEIAELKETYQDDIKISMGVDFGSGYPSSTVISIVTEWKIKSGQSRYQLAHIEKRPAEHQLDQAEYICNLFKRSRCDIGVGDLGYGAIQVKTIQEGGYSRQSGAPFSGVGSAKFIGCRTVSDESRPVQTFDERTDEHGDKTAMMTIDKTSAIQEFIDMFDVLVPHPARNDEDCKRRRLMIPFKDEHKVDWLVGDFTAIRRKDLLQTKDALVDPRQRARKEFNHPKDSVMSVIYAIKGLALKPEWIYVAA